MEKKGQGQPRCKKTNPGSVCCGRGCCDMLPVKEVQMTGNFLGAQEDEDRDVAFTGLILARFYRKYGRSICYIAP